MDWRRTVLAISISTFGMCGALAQTAAPLNEIQESGGILTSQTCVVCHFPLQQGAHTYGPRLHKDTMMGDESSLRAVISEGSQRMPGFKYMFNSQQIGAVVQFIKTLPPPPPEAAKKE